MQVTTLLRRVFLILLCFLVTTALGQESSRRFNIGGGAGAGFTLPTADSSNNLNMGWNLNVRGGFNVDRHLLTDLDFSFDHWGLSNAALANFGQPGGYADVWSISFVPVIRFMPGHEIDPYVLAGAGLYHRNLSLTQPATAQTIFCDPFFGYCYPAVIGVNEVVASFSTYKPGFDVGGGFEFRLGSSRLKAFAEARYNSMFTTYGPNLTFVPVTFGLRW
ncbi:MAG TPA: outer membrane beta-barrel protein [Terriglobales bacterium]|nr:outer membrane beta-barrel protein [Terriglobales bacterium]